MSIIHGDCVEVMAGMEPESVDAIVCDPPYAFPGGFMGKSWDRIDGREDAGFANWLAGLIDGEGHFAIKAHTRGSHAPAFALKMRADEEGTLRLIQRTLKIGTVEREPREESNDLVRWVVQDKAGCQRLVDILDKYPLRAKKRLDYDIWREAVCEWTDRPRGNRWHGPADNTRMAGLRDRLMSVRKYVDVPWSGDHFQDWTRLWAQEAYRVLKPGSWILASGAPKRVHRMTAGLEDAGFEIRDMLIHGFASGFPKGRANLKPAYEPWVLARKPGPLRMLAIDECRIPSAEGDDDIGRVRAEGYGSKHPGWTRPWMTNDEALEGRKSRTEDAAAVAASLGRWPANIILTDPIFDGGVEGVVGGGESGPVPGVYTRTPGILHGAAFHPGAAQDGREVVAGYGDSGTYSRFFLVPKSSRADREPVLTPDGHDRSTRFSTHPTVKPTDLMRHLVRLVTPTGGIVLDPFLGSGTTALAAEMEGFAWVGIEREEEYVRIAEARLNGTQRGLGLESA